MKPFAIAVAKKAGLFLQKNFLKDPSLLAKRATAKELKTKYDKASDKLIIQEISRKYPSHSLLTEESGFIAGKSKEKSFYTWIVDSLDGSTNFARGNPFFAVSIALAKRNELLLGIIYAPALNELYVAEQGKGAYLNGKRIHVSSTSAISHAYFLSCEGGDKTNERIAKINALFHPYCKDLRKLGSAALECAAVASGRADAYFSTAMDPWDVAAGVLLVEEAGGTVTDLKGRKISVAGMTSILCTNGKLHYKVLNTTYAISCYTP